MSALSRALYSCAKARRSSGGLFAAARGTARALAGGKALDPKLLAKRLRVSVRSAQRLLVLLDLVKKNRTRINRRFR